MRFDGGPIYAGGPWKHPAGRWACEEPSDGWVSSPVLPCIGDTAQERVAKVGQGQDTHLLTHPPTYLQPRAGTQILTCGGWQAGGHSGPGAHQG